MASIKDILASYGSAARNDYPQGDEVEDAMDCIVYFISQHGYEFEDSLLEDLRQDIGLCPIRDVNDRGINRTFAFQAYQEYFNCYADDWLPSKIDHYSYVGEIAKHQEKPTVLYECDGMACKEPCNKECHHTLDISHAKNFKCENGLWIEHRDYSPKNLYC